MASKNHCKGCKKQWQAGRHAGRQAGREDDECQAGRQAGREDDGCQAGRQEGRWIPSQKSWVAKHAQPSHVRAG